MSTATPAQANIPNAEWPSFGLPKLAGTIFDLKRALDTCENVLWGALQDFAARANAEVKRFDFYDCSVEIWADSGAELSDDEQATLWTLGFDRCWVCWRDEAKTEKYYAQVSCPRAR